MKPRVALAGWFGAGNLGDELILRALAGALRARGASPFAVSIRPDHTRRLHGLDSIAHRSPAQHRSLVKALRSAGAMVVAGGVIQAETSPWNIPFHASRLRAAAAAGCPVAAVGVGVGRVPGRLGRGILRRGLRPVGALVVRDRDSAERMRRWGLPEAAVGADPVLGLTPAAAEPDDGVCVILRTPNRRGPGTAAAKSRSMPGADALDRLARSVEAVAAVTGLTPRLTPFQAARDGPLHRAVADRLDGAAEVAAPTLRTVLREVGRSRLVITMRYHGAVAALLHGRPAVLLDYSPKMGSLAAEGRGWAATADPSRLGPDLLVRAVADAFDAARRLPRARSELQSRLAENDAALDGLVATAAAAAGR